jgi:Secretion system C-terminal sorting domain
MKTIKSLALVLITSSAVAQIPNNGFENWSTMGTYENPDSWGTLNNTTAMASVFTATKGTPGSPGASYLKLTSLTIGPGVVNGIAVSGVLDTIAMLPKSGFAYTTRSANFTGKWQHMIFGSSQGGITVLLTQWNTSLNKRDTVAIANQTLSGMAMSWANFTIPFTYFNGNNPDSCIIFLRASGSAPTNNDYLWVDNLGFSGVVTGVNETDSYITNVSAFPNPASSHINLTFELKEVQNVNLSMADITGKIIYSKDLEVVHGVKNEVISCDGISKGTYFITLHTVNGSLTQKVVLD